MDRWRWSRTDFPVLILAPDDAACEGVVELAELFVERGAQVMVAGAVDADWPDRVIRLPLPAGRTLRYSRSSRSRRHTG